MSLPKRRNDRLALRRAVQWARLRAYDRRLRGLRESGPQFVVQRGWQSADRISNQYRPDTPPDGACAGDSEVLLSSPCLTCTPSLRNTLAGNWRDDEALGWQRRTAGHDWWRVQRSAMPRAKPVSHAQDSDILEFILTTGAQAHHHLERRPCTTLALRRCKACRSLLQCRGARWPDCGIGKVYASESGSDVSDLTALVSPYCAAAGVSRLTGPARLMLSPPFDCGLQRRALVPQVAD